MGLSSLDEKGSFENLVGMKSRFNPVFTVFTWPKEIPLELMIYTGMEINDELLERTRKKTYCGIKKI